jgi:ribosomal-protein-alanine N-acetyltransferase
MLAIPPDIEFATAADAAEISRLSHQYIEYNLRRVYTPARVRRAIQSASKNVVVARQDGALLGFAIMTYSRDSANLDLLAVKKSCRRRGVASRLLKWLERVALTAGIANVFVQVRETNPGAVRFYQRMGYQVVDEVASYYQRRESALIMCKGIRQMVLRFQRVDAGID